MENLEKCCKEFNWKIVVNTIMVFTAMLWDHDRVLMVNPNLMTRRQENMIAQAIWDKEVRV